MTSEEFRNSIKTGKLQLNSSYKLSYFREPILMFIIATFCLTTGFQSITAAFNEEQPLGTIGLIFLSTSTLYYFFLNHQLQVKDVSVKISKEEFHEKVYKLTKDQDWKIITISENFLDATHKRSGGGRYLIEQNCGERIYIYNDTQNLYFKSIFDMDRNYAFTISLGENQLNEKIIKNIFLASD